MTYPQSMEKEATNGSKSLARRFIQCSTSTKSEEEFEKLLNGFLTQTNNLAPQYINYFQSEYLDQTEQWAMCHRNFDHANTDTSMFVESFHNRLKTFFMQRKINKRIDDLVILLLDIEEEEYWRYVT